MSVEQNIFKEEEQHVEYNNMERRTFTAKTVEVYFDNEINHATKLSYKKKQKKEHRKAKKRKHKEISNESSDDNLSNIKARHQLTLTNKKQKKNKKVTKKKCNDFRDVYIKQEIFSENEQNVSDESDEDVPLSLLDRDRIKHPKVKIKKTYEISNSADVSEVEGKVKKLKIKKVSDDKTTCMECGKSFSSNLKYKAHMRKVHGQKPFVCVICCKAFHKEKDLLNHHNTHTGQNPYCCGECGKLFKSDGTLKKHVRIFHADNTKKYSCSMCSKILSSASCLEEHERLHTGENPWSCNLCGKLFARERDLKLHGNLHDELFKCDYCQRCFITSFKLKEHYRSHTGETPYECDKCDRKFSRLADYRYHVGTHLGLKPFACELCGMKFTTSSSMKRHLINMHQKGPLDFKCHVCDKAFHTQTRLNSHVKNHENKKKYTCHICNATRSSQSELQRHLILHSGEFRCDTCNRNCSSAERLAAHVAKHDLTGKPYACFVCSLGYQTSQSLNKHLATVHKNEDIPKVSPQHLCTLCGNVFDHKDKLNRHLKDDHVVLAVGEIHSLIEDEQYSNYKANENISKANEDKIDNSEVDESVKVCDSGNQFTVNEVSINNSVSDASSVITESVIKKKDKLKKNINTNCKQGSKNGIRLTNEDLVIKDNNVKEQTKNDGTIIKSKPVSDEIIKETSKPDKLDTANTEFSKQSNSNVIGTNMDHDKNVLQDNTLMKHSSCVKAEKDDYCSNSNSEDNEKMLGKDNDNADEIIQNLARKNIESYLQKQETEQNTNCTLDKQLEDFQNSSLNNSKNSSFDYQSSNKRTNEVVPTLQSGEPPHVNDEVSKYLETPISNVTEPSLTQLLNNDVSISYRDALITKKEMEVPLIQSNGNDYVRESQEKVTSVRNSHNIPNNITQTTNYFDDFGVKDLSTSSASKMQHKYEIYDNLYSKTHYNEQVSSHHNKIMSQNSYKNIHDAFPNYNQMQSTLHQTPNPWYLSNKISMNDEESVLKQNVSKILTEPKSKEVKSSRIDNVFQMQLHGYNQYSNNNNNHQNSLIKSQLDPIQDIIMQSNNTFHNNKDNYYDKKPYATSNNMEYNKSYFMHDYNQKQFAHDDRKRSTHLYNDAITKQTNRSNYPALPNHFTTTEHSIPSSLSFRDHFNTSDQFNYYNSHTFATMANSPHLFQNFRDLQQRMLSSGISGYNHHSRQHLFSGMDVSNQRSTNNNTSSSSSLYHHQLNSQSNLNSIPPLSRHSYDLTSSDMSITNFQNTRQNSNNTNDGQGKDDDNNGPYELRVAAN